jgi:general secretion pathway protein A
MYRAYYDLKFKPFQISSDPAFLWLGEKHKEALATLRYGILDNKGFLLLTGDVGTGKTTLINTLKASLGQDVICTAVPDPSLDKLDFYNYVARGFGFDREITSKGRFLLGFSKFLHTAHDDNKKVLLIIDEAQLLTQALLEEIRLLSNVELAETKLLNIFFIGQNEFNEVLSRPQNRAVRQRLTLNYNLEPLSLSETDDYIRHRLNVAGTTERLFEEEAVREIYNASRGFPRRINVLCDHALLTGYVQDKRLMDVAIIRECIRELDIPVNPKQAKPVRATSAAQSQVVSPASPASPASPPQPRAPVAPPEPAPRKSLPAYAFLVIMALLFLAGWVLYPDRVQRFIVTANHYLGGGAVELSGFLPDKVSSPPIPGPSDAGEGKNLPPADVPVTGIAPVIRENVSQTVQETGDTMPPVVESFPIIDSIETVVSAQAQAPKENLAELNDPPPEEPPVEVAPPLLEKKVVVRFQYNSNDFSEQGMEALIRFADTLVFYPEARVIITGYTDSYGNQAYNRKLSEFRANIVKSFLLGKGAFAEQMTTSGLGSDNPIESNDSSWGRMLNRRVEIEVE